MRQVIRKRDTRMEHRKNVSDRSSGSVASPSKAWAKSLEHVFNSVVEANRATRAALGFPGVQRSNSGTNSLTYRLPEWDTDIQTRSPDVIAVGDVVTFSKRIEESDVEQFAVVSGDTNRLHLDEEFAEESRFGGQIAHGTLVSGLISAALARLPGLTIYLSQEVRFLMPVSIGDELTARCEVVEDLGENQYRITTKVLTEDGDLVIDGEAQILIDELPE